MRAAPGLLVPFVAVLLLVPVASAHANLKEATPAPNSKLDPADLPREVVLRFTEPLDSSFTRAQLLNDEQENVAAGPAEITSEMEMRVPFPDALPDGIYVLTWRALSTVDGHTTAGAFVYIVGNASVPRNFSDIIQSEEVTVADGGGPVEGAGRGIFYVGAFLATGVAFFVIALAGPVGDASPRYRRAAGRIALAGAAIAAIGALVAATAFAARVTDGTLTADAWWARVTGTRIGVLWIARAGAMLIAGAALLTARRWPRAAWTGAALAGLAAFTFQALAGHSAALPYAWLGVLLDVVHLATGAIWLGGLPALALALASDESHVRRAAVAAGFSALATWSVAAVVLSGTVLSYAHLGNLANLWLTPWGRALLAKLALVVVLLAFGAFNQFVLLPRVRTGHPAALRRLWRSILGESATALALIVTVVLLTAQSPPGTAGAPAATSDPEGILVLSSVGKYGTNFTLRIGPADPITPGLHLYEVKLTNATANVTNANVTLFFTYLEEDIGTSTANPEHVEDGAYRTLSGNLALPGLWRIEAKTSGRPDTFDESVAWDVVVEGSGGA